MFVKIKIYKKTVDKWKNMVYIACKVNEKR